MNEDKELENLSPEEKLRKLKERQEKGKEKLKQTEKLILEEKKEMERQEKIKKELERIELPEQKEVDIKKLFTEKEESLEETVKKAEPTSEELNTMRQYEIKLSKDPIEEIYNKVKDIRSEFEEKGYMSESQKDELNALGYAIDYKQKDIDHGEYKSTTERIDDIIGSAKSIIKYLK